MSDEAGAGRLAIYLVLLAEFGGKGDR